MNRIARFSLYGLLALALLCAGLATMGWNWAQRSVDMNAQRIEYLIEPGSTPRSVARRLNEAGIHINETAFLLLARLSGQDTQIKAGAYEALQGDTPVRLLARMARGEMVQARLTLIEGWPWRRIRAALAANERLEQTLGELSDAELIERLGTAHSHLEGLFYPDTYVFTPGTTDFEVLRQAYQAQAALLEAMWASRDPDLGLASPYEALILASLIEKETGHGEDRARISGVFINRLRLGMPLQTDPSVIYGMGDAYQGRIRKADLRRDTPWNTYTRPGLPPSPIASPGRASLQAALHPEKHDYLYFVSRGDGTSEFSRNLAAHNRAVARYILGRRN